MNILIAFADRDMAACAEALFTHRGDTVVSVRDGTQIPLSARETHLDAAVIDGNLPRYDAEKTAEFLRDRDIRIVNAVLKKPSAALLAASHAADAYIVFPFEPDDLLGVTDGICGLKGREPLVIGDTIADVAGMKLGGERLTYDEILFLSDAASGVRPARADDAVTARAVNIKLERENKKARVGYFAGIGYGVVMTT